MKLHLSIRALALMFAVMGANSSLSFAQVQYELQPKTIREALKKSDKTDWIFWGANGALTAATVLDMKSTADILNHPSCAYREDNSLLTCGYHGIEKGWTGKMFGARNEFAAITGNSLLNACITYTARRLYQGDGKWKKKVAIALLLLKAADNTKAAFGNIGYSGSVDGRIRTALGYGGRIYWSRPH